MPDLASSKSSETRLTARIRRSFTGAGTEFSLNVDFSVTPGFTIFFGPSGSGKTTLLDCIAGLTVPDTGQITLGTQTLFDSATGITLPTAKRRIGYVFQDLALFPHLTVERNIEYGLSSLPQAIRRQRVNAILQDFRIDHLRRRRPTEISGGERQRVALARTLVTDPCVLMLDEPLAALDTATKSKILDDLRRWNQAHNVPILYVTHSREEVIALGERVLVLDKGRIIAQGTPHEVLRAPLQETVAQLSGFENIFDATVESIHEDRGTMLCRLSGQEDHGSLTLETPLISAEPGSRLRVGIRAGDILLAVVEPEGLSARNIIPGRIVSREQRDMIVAAHIDCGVAMEVYLTLAARDALQLEAGREVWLIIKTHSCHLMQK